MGLIRRLRKRRPKIGIRSRATRQVLLEPLEPRILLSTDPLTDATALTAAGELTRHYDSDQPAPPPVTDIAPGEFSPVLDEGWLTAPNSADPQSGDDPDRPAEGNSVDLAGRRLVFVDPAVTGYEELLAGMPAADSDIRVVVLDPGRDGIAQITETLAANHDVAAVHILSHGADGSIQLGNTRLSADTLNRYTDQLQAWRTALGAGADILLYGCNVAKGAWGVDFVENLSALTGADIAASDDLTGSATLGGDWELEVTSGAIENHPLFTAETTVGYGHTLDSFIGTSGNDNLTGTPRPDTMEGRAKHDILDGAAGDDTILGGTGNDTLKGGSGDDSLTGGAGNDLIEGGPGADILIGGDGNDTLKGGAGDDSYRFVDGAFGKDTVTDGEGSDSLDFSQVNVPLTFKIKKGGAMEVFPTSP